MNFWECQDRFESRLDAFKRVLPHVGPVPAVYRIWIPGTALSYIGSSKNVQQRVYAILSVYGRGNVCKQPFCSVAQKFKLEDFKVDIIASSASFSQLEREAIEAAYILRERPSENKSAHTNRGTIGKRVAGKRMRIKVSRFCYEWICKRAGETGLSPESAAIAALEFCARKPDDLDWRMCMEALSCAS